MATETPRSREARELAERALLWFVAELLDTDPPIVLGGLVPETLVEYADETVPDHIGTIDVDLLIALHLDPDADLSGVEAALNRMGAEPDPKIDGWRWDASLSGARVKFEFLCDVDAYPKAEVLGVPGCARLKAANLRGSGYVAEDWVWRELEGALPSGDKTRQRVRFAGLQGYLLSKSFAARHRGEDKDYYDLVYVLRYNRLGGPKEAGEALRTGPLADRLDDDQSVWRELRARFATSDGVGPKGYVDQALQAEPDADAAQLAEDAVTVVDAFLRALGK